MPLRNRTEAFLAFIDTRLRAAQWALDENDIEEARKALAFARQSIEEWHRQESGERKAVRLAGATKERSA